MKDYNIIINKIDNREYEANKEYALRSHDRLSFYKKAFFRVAYFPSYSLVTLRSYETDVLQVYLYENGFKYVIGDLYESDCGGFPQPAFSCYVKKPIPYIYSRTTERHIDKVLLDLHLYRYIPFYHIRIKSIDHPRGSKQVTTRQVLRMFHNTFFNKDTNLWIFNKNINFKIIHNKKEYKYFKCGVMEV